MPRGRKKKVVEEKQPVGQPDAFDKASQAKVKAPKPKPAPAPEPDTDDENMSESEAAKMTERAQTRKQEAVAKVEATVDSQEWTTQDPVIPEELKGRAWIAVYRCPDGHKTKATNRQSGSGVWCAKHRESGQQVKAEIMPQFMTKPEPPDSDIEKRRQARKGAE